MTYESEGQQLIDHELKSKEAAAVREHELKEMRIDSVVGASVVVTVVAAILSSVVTCSSVHAPESATNIKEMTESVRRLERQLAECVEVGDE